MTFTTLTFILFLWLVFALYWTLRYRTAQNILLIVASYSFYAWWDYRFCALMLISSLIDYIAALSIDRSPKRGVRRAWMWVSVAMNLGMLGFFKYFNFFAESFTAMMRSLGWEVGDVTLKIVLPVGISFYTFQTMSYTLDVYFGKMRATRRLIDYMAYVCFFPQLVAGPIERATQFLPQFTAPRTFDDAEATDGCRQILWGFFKKMIIADRMAILVAKVYGSDGTGVTLDQASGPTVIFGTIAFAFQIYCDFSAYSDIAIGTAKLFGFRLMRNFAYPYFSQSIRQFWQRWHISLSTWFRDYVYIPLGGNRGSSRRLAINLMITFIVSGLWHGASWTFITWGALMGLAIVVSTWRARRAAAAGLAPADRSDTGPAGPRLMRMLCTFAVICLGWIFFRAPTMASATAAVGRVFTDVCTLQGFDSCWELMRSNAGAMIFVLIPLLLAIEWVQRHRDHPLDVGTWPRWARWTLYTVVIWGIILWMPKVRAPFIYFQF
ncbi:MAG: MBOAT family O-acyltransferase [Phycisphaeraceae bacterium]